MSNVPVAPVNPTLPVLITIYDWMAILTKRCCSAADAARHCCKLSAWGATKRHDGFRNRVVETTVQCAKFVCGNGYILFDRECRHRLAYIPIIVQYLIDAVSDAQQFSAV